MMIVTQKLMEMKGRRKKMSETFREISIEEFLDNNAHCIYDGYVAQESNGNWFWYGAKPEPDLQYQTWNLPEPEWSLLNVFNIKRERDWTKTLYEIKDGKWRKVDE